MRRLDTALLLVRGFPPPASRMTTTTAAHSALAEERAPAPALALAASSADAASSSAANTSPRSHVLQLASVHGLPAVQEPPRGAPCCLLRVEPYADGALIVTPVDVQTTLELPSYFAFFTHLVLSSDGKRAVAMGDHEEQPRVLWRLSSLNDRPIVEVLRPVMSARVRIIVRDYALHFVQKDSESPLPPPMRLSATARSLTRGVPGLGWLPKAPAAGMLDVWVVDGRVQCRARKCTTLACAIRHAGGRIEKLPGWNAIARQANGCTRELPHGAALVIGAVEDPPGSDTWRLPTADETSAIFALDFHLCVAADTQCVCCSPPCDLDNPPRPEAAVELQSACRAARAAAEITPEAMGSDGGGRGGRARKQTVQHEAPDERKPHRGGPGAKRGRSGAGKRLDGTGADRFR